MQERAIGDAISAVSAALRGHGLEFYVKKDKIFVPGITGPNLNRLTEMQLAAPVERHKLGLVADLVHKVPVGDLLVTVKPARFVREKAGSSATHVQIAFHPIFRER